MTTPSVFARSFDAFLFDMDGTLVDSTPAAERIWGHWCDKRGLKRSDVLPHMHGVRATDTIRRFGPAGTDVQADADWVTQEEIKDLEGVTALPGVVEFLSALPLDRWAIVTSASLELAHARLAYAGIPMPKTIVTAEQIAHGKPAPDPYLRGAELLGFDARNCLVWEDAPAGIASGVAAGAEVMVLTATHLHAYTYTQHAVPDYANLRVRIETDGTLRVSSN